MDYITLFLEDDPDPLLLGGKGSNMINLIKAGANVPPGFIVNTRSYEKFFQESEYAEQLNNILSLEFSSKETIRLSAEIKDLILRSSVPEEIQKELNLAYKKMVKNEGEDLSLAVRSSATIEDSSRFSFAGQADSFLYVNSFEEIIISVKQCWASLFSPQSLLYLLQMKKKGLELSLLEIKMAVIIQKMINSDISGILFTANVVNNDQSQMFLNASWGLGNSIADNLVIPDTIILRKENFEILKIIIGKKEKKTIRNPEGTGTIMINVNQDLRKICSLNEAQLRSIHALGLKIEKAFGCPQDIELAIENGVLYILQARPITTLGVK